MKLHVQFNEVKTFESAMMVALALRSAKTSDRSINTYPFEARVVIDMLPLTIEVSCTSVLNDEDNISECFSRGHEGNLQLRKMLTSAVRNYLYSYIATTIDTDKNARIHDLMQGAIPMKMMALIKTLGCNAVSYGYMSNISLTLLKIGNHYHNCHTAYTNSLFDFGFGFLHAIDELKIETIEEARSRFSLDAEALVSYMDGTVTLTSIEDEEAALTNEDALKLLKQMDELFICLGNIILENDVEGSAPNHVIDLHNIFKKKTELLKSYIVNHD